MVLKDIKVGMSVYVRGTERNDKRPAPKITSIKPNSSGPDEIELEFNGPEWFFPYRSWFTPEDLEEAE